MKKLKIFCCAAISAALAMSFSACSVIDNITGDVSTSSTGGETNMSSVEVKQIDKNLAQPQFNNALTGSVIVSQGTGYSIDGTAVSPDGGEVSYQWYSNNINSNSGGSVIEGATGATYIPDSTETGTKFYFVVASNNHGNSYNMVTSNVCQVDVLQSGEWSTDEFGGTRYLAADGSYPANVIMVIGDYEYRFDENGYRYHGWFDAGDYNFYYYDEEGRLIKNGETPEGYHTDGNGHIVEQINPFDGSSTAPAPEVVEEIPVEQPAEQPQAEEAATEEAAQ